jgi:hypothetical protein
MTAHGRLADPERVVELAGATRALAEQRDDPSPGRIRERLERSIQNLISLRDNYRRR